MTLALALLLAAVTFASRATALVLLPAPPPRVAALLDRMPAPLFAGLAALTVVGEDGVVADPIALSAIAGAVLAAPTRSLPVVLGAGLGAAGLATWFA